MCCEHYTEEYYYVDFKGDHVAVGATVHKPVLFFISPSTFLNEGYKNDDDDFALNNTTEKQWEWINNTKYYVCILWYTCLHDAYVINI